MRARGCVLQGPSILVVASILILPVLTLDGTAQAGWLDKAVDSAIKGAGEGAKEAVKNPPKTSPSSEPGGSQAEDVEASGSQGGSPASDPQAAKGKPPQPADASGGDFASAEVAYARYDFVPGDKVIFWDDFSDTDLSDFPRKWSVKCTHIGIYSDQPLEVAESQGKKYLRVQPPPSSKDDQNESGACIRWKEESELPEKFTVEFDAVLGLVEGSSYEDVFYNLAVGTSEIYISGTNVKTENTSINLNKADGGLHHVAVSINGTSVKVYIDNERFANDPDAVERPVNGLGMELGTINRKHYQRVMFTNFRIAEGGKDIKSALETDGKIVTHGILFDSGSDKLKPESLPTLKKILALLEGDSSLKFSIEGHTDNQGGKGVNQPLSERRAAAVKAWLEGKGIAAARLQAKGWGDSKPIGANDTAEGRANNRRVEFVKI